MASRVLVLCISAAALAGLLLGCAPGGRSGSGPLAAPHADVPPTHRIAGVPFVPGEPGACGPAALASVLAFWGDPVSVQEIAAALAVPTLAGVLPLDLERFATERGGTSAVRIAHGTLPWLRERLAADQPAIVLLDLGIGPVRQGHFVVAVGYDDDAERVLLYSGRESAATMSYRRFASSWKRAGSWALTLDGRRNLGNARSS